MAQRQVEERLDMIKREVVGIKEAIMNLGKNMEQSIKKLTIEMRETRKLVRQSKGESSTARGVETSATEEASNENVKGKEKG